MQVNTESTELALKTASTEIASFVNNAIKEVEALEAQYSNVVPIATTKEGYKECKQVRRDLMPIKKGLEDARKSLKAPILEAGRLIDSNMNPLAERVANIIKPFENAYREVDQEIERKKQERLDKIDNAFNAFDEAILNCVGSTSTFIENMIDEMADFDLSPDVFMERTDEAANKHSEVMTKLGSMLKESIEREEFEAKQRAIEERERAIAEKEEAERQRIEAEKQAQLQAEREKQMELERQKAAEQARIEAEERHKREMELAEQRAKEQAEQAVIAERERLERIAQQEFKASLDREKDRAHKASIHNSIVEDICKAGITQEQAKNIVKLIAMGSVANVKISY